MATQGKPRAFAGGAEVNAVGAFAGSALCERCSWPVPDGERRCVNCRGIVIFQMAARIIGRAIASEPNMLARLVLLKRFFGVAVNTWEQMRLFGDVPSVDKS